MEVFCGIDWAENHHDIALAGQHGQLLARRRISDDPAGLAVLLDLLAEHGDTPEDLIPVAIETPRGLLTACLRATGRPVYPINPMAVARYRDRHSIAGRKSDLLTELREGLSGFGGRVFIRVARFPGCDRRWRRPAGLAGAGGAAARVA